MSSLFSGWEDAKGEGQPADTPEGPSVYTEMRLMGLLKTQEEVDKLLQCCSSAADVHCLSSWTDITLQTAVHSTGCMDMRKRAETPQEVTLRWYHEPGGVKDTCALYYQDQGVLVGGLHAKKAAETAKVYCTQTTQAMRGVLRALGFRRLGSIHVKANVFHFKPKTARHVVLLLQQHFLDPQHTRPLWGQDCCWLVELQARLSSDAAATAAAEAALAAVAETLKPVVTLRKMDPKDYAEAEANAMRAAAA
ncbi:hypothetical protein, conserved [Eimeria brunetti]|uniref:Mediator complex subunit 18 n=1 Tax=Eimeria brunetti TaxID=51314 RepID=U6LR10_9EIME|nr:hypothetical protein, conserved [Eimeria brunetti]